MIPVIDLLDGRVVRGVGGRRAEYRPITSPLVTAPDPLTVATALRQLCGHATLYVADLDAILHRQPHTVLYEQLTSAGGTLLVDAGVREVADALAVAATGADVIVGLETVADALTLRRIAEAISTDRLVFSVDLMHGCSLGGAGWPDRAPDIIEQVLACGITRLIVLDLADVGTDSGGSTEGLCRQILTCWPTVRLIAGGGVRGPDDLARWSQVGVEGVLIASALHDGRIAREDIEGIANNN
ncbi:MAG: HisA/HisF-related TIM barrel protein [Planctomycetaceae bacterium]|nr:HisA/HisF-related TIM barrel protein [Planctomycetaceae bacterium]